MSTSPTRYYASKPSSRPTSPQTPAEVRSQAVAKLKRAASLPRQRDGRRPTLPNLQNASPTPPDAQASPVPMSTEPGLSNFIISPNYGAEEFLSPSPVTQTFNHAGLYPTQGPSMSRTPSGSSSYHIPTPPHMGSSSPYYNSASPSPTPDWASLHLAQSYLPSLSPIGLGPVLGKGRNTPSPLPSLGDLRDLQRSNSAAARAKAMSKLTGGRNTPSEEDQVIHGIQLRPNLQRSDSLGAPRPVAVLAALPTPEPAFAESKPRLQRSFTVSSSNMGEERRSAVGRRMVERLAERRAARDQEELEVRKLWQERRAEVDDGRSDQDSEEEEHIIPLVNRSSPLEPLKPTFTPPQDMDMLNPDRPISRNTMRSNAEPFEYEAHLRRSLSSRTARGAVGTAPEILPRLAEPMQINATAEHLDPPHPTFVTPTRHVPHNSASTDHTIKDQSPSMDSAISGDALHSMMFVVGSGSNTSVAPRQGSFPMGVEENGASDWGTPARDMRPAFDDSPLANEREDNNPTPPGISTRSSVMSWEEVGGPNDREVPSDVHYHIKSGSISAKIGRNWTAMRKKSHSHSRSSVASSITSPPTSPKGLSITSFSRRGSESSLSPSQSSASRAFIKAIQGDNIRHQPSISSLSPTIPREPSANSILLQHQLSAEATPPSLLPRADPNDPRIHSSKLSPFPGLAQLEQGQTPKLIHQSSDSAVPSQQRAQPATGDSIYSLPLLTSPESRRASDDSVSKRSWLAKAFGQQKSPRSSGSVSRKSSNLDLSRKASNDSHDSDPFAAPPPPSAKPRHRSVSPSVSVVHEVSEEGSRFTRFTNGTRLDTASPLIEEEEKLPPKSVGILKRMDNLLALSADDPVRPDILDDPPRKLFLATQVLQVVNAHTAKDRFLFLFNDILVITRPLLTSSMTATLDNQFLVKSVVQLDKLVVSDTNYSPKSETCHSAISVFIDLFDNDPVAACKYLMEGTALKVDVTTLASIIFKTPELDKANIGALLSNNEKLLESYIDRFNFAGIRIDDALRMFLLSLRMPTDPIWSETLLRGFAQRYLDANLKRVTFDQDLAVELVFSMMHLNDSFYGMYGFALLNTAITEQVFISAFRSKDPGDLVPDQLLSEVYASIKSSPIFQALQDKTLQKQIAVTPSEATTTKLTYDTWSDWIYVTLPSPDPRFRVALMGDGLEFDPPKLDFSNDKEQRFRVNGKSLGTKTILFARLGRNALAYPGLGNGRTVVVERAFMKNTFQLAFTSHLGSRRKYCYSVQDEQIRTKWVQALIRQTALTKSAKSASTPSSTDPRAVIRYTAEAVSFQVLCDALIPRSDPPSKHGETRQPQQRHHRSGSVSKAYAHNMGKKEEALGPLRPSKPTLTSERKDGLVEVNSGKELVLVCRQNSLLPSLLELLQSGVAESTSTTTMAGTSTGLASQIGAGMAMSSLGRMASMRGGRV
ncbi:hypothetical protein BCR39DRAFT_558172 [Naematelia encephala]|uniref:SEC7 domain-containing protein n=1 Tax=Naematelia encephala TaxID=71784 RepID=A0A1Y2B984_9TREE|nr:hypothetical protein BCR39DRAFT_558172 [Naematelia encephala]